MADRETQLSPKQERAAAALLATSTLEEAARKARVGVRSLHRWRRLPAFREAMRQLARDSYAEATAELRALALDAVDTLRRGMKGEIESALPIRCAIATLERCASLDADDVLARIEELEAAAERAEQRRGYDA